MNARGAMEIILGLLALEAGIIRPPLFVALVVMALVTSAASGPFIRRVLPARQSDRLFDLLSPDLFIRNLASHSRLKAIRELATLASKHADVDARAVEELAWRREQVAATGIGNGVALPHARLEGLPAPIVVAGLSDSGIPFDAPDGRPAHAVFLLITPRDDPAVQLELSSHIAQLFRDPESLDIVMRATNSGEFLAALQTLDRKARQ